MSLAIHSSPTTVTQMIWPRISQEINLCVRRRPGQEKNVYFGQVPKTDGRERNYDAKKKVHNNIELDND